MVNLSNISASASLLVRIKETTSCMVRDHSSSSSSIRKGLLMLCLMLYSVSQPFFFCTFLKNSSTSTSSLTSCFVTLKKFAPGKKHQDILSHRKLSVSRSRGDPCRLAECSPQERPWKSCLLRLALK